MYVHNTKVTFLHSVQTLFEGCFLMQASFVATKVAPIVGSAIGIGRHWVSVTLSVIVFSFVLYQRCHLEHVTFVSKVLCRVVTLLQYLPLVYSGSAVHGITRKEDVTSMGLLLCR